MHDFTRQIKAKGWTAKEAGVRWGLKPRQMSQIASNPLQKHLDMLDGLPEKDKQEESTE
jgi:hypothetical protein